jgi:hypothetical protein
LKSGIESLSGFSLDDVKVHYNSPEPAQLKAHAFAQGTDIHMAPGQEKHLPHEAWHVVQQKQGRVKPTMQMKGKVNVNDDAGLEKEADVMGERAMLRKREENSESHPPAKTLQRNKFASKHITQFVNDGDQNQSPRVQKPNSLENVDVSESPKAGRRAGTLNTPSAGYRGDAENNQGQMDRNTEASKRMSPGVKRSNSLKNLDVSESPRAGRRVGTLSKYPQIDNTPSAGYRGDAENNQGQRDRNTEASKRIKVLNAQLYAEVLKLSKQSDGKVVSHQVLVEEGGFANLSCVQKFNAVNAALGKKIPIDLSEDNLHEEMLSPTTYQVVEGISRLFVKTQWDWKKFAMHVRKVGGHKAMNEAQGSGKETYGHVDLTTLSQDIYNATSEYAKSLKETANFTGERKSRAIYMRRISGLCKKIAIQLPAIQKLESAIQIAGSALKLNPISLVIEGFLGATESIMDTDDKNKQIADWKSAMTEYAAQGQKSLSTYAEMQSDSKNLERNKAAANAGVGMGQLAAGVVLIAVGAGGPITLGIALGVLIAKLSVEVIFQAVNALKEGGHSLKALALTSGRVEENPYKSDKDNKMKNRDLQSLGYSENELPQFFKDWKNAMTAYENAKQKRET